MGKRSLFVLVAAFLFAVRVEAQTPYGILGGINRANLSVSNAGGNEDFDTLTGMEFGGWLDIRLGQMVDLRLEPMYLRREGDIPWSWDGNVKTRGLQIVAGVPLSPLDF